MAGPDELVPKVLRILRAPDSEYHAIKQDLDEHFPQQGWTTDETASGPFAAAFTHAEDAGGWLSAEDRDRFLYYAEVADEQAPSSGDDLYRFLRSTIDAWHAASATAGADIATDTAAAEVSGTAASAGFQGVADLTGNYAGWQQGYDPDAQAWKYRQGTAGVWRESLQAFPAIAPGSRIFLIGERTFLRDGDAEGEVWPNPNAPGTYYDTARSYDRLGNPLTAKTDGTAAPDRANRANPPEHAPDPADKGEELSAQELEQTLRELFDIPPDQPIVVLS